MPRMSVSSMCAITSLLCWCVSLFVPAVDLGFSLAYGWQFLLYGWQGLASLNIGGFSWLANPLLWGAWLCFLFWPERRALLITSALAALAVGLTSFLYNAFGSEQEGITIQAFAPGFYLWLLSVLLQAVAAIMKSRAPAG